MRRSCAASLSRVVASLSRVNERALLAPLIRRLLWMRDARSLPRVTRTIDGRSSSTQLNSAAEKRGTAGGRGRTGFLSQLRSSSMGYRRAWIFIQPRLRLRVRYFALRVRRFSVSGCRQSSAAVRQRPTCAVRLRACRTCESSEVSGYDGSVRYGGGPKMRAAFVPPKPNEFESA
jgi:hypothetical protein